MLAGILKAMAELKGELLAVAVIMGANLWFVVKLFELRKNFELHIDFWLCLSFVELIVLIVCGQILRVYQFRVGSGATNELVERQAELLRGPAAPEVRRATKPHNLKKEQAP